MPTENWWFWFERNPSQHFIAAIRRVFPDFQPVDAGWDKLGMAIQLRACKTVDEVRSMQPHDVELFLDLYWPPAVPADAMIGEPKQKANSRTRGRRQGTSHVSGSRGGHNKKPITGWITTIAEMRKDRDGTDPVKAVMEIQNLGNVALAELIFRELSEPVSDKAIQRWRRRQQGKVAAPAVGLSEAVDEDESDTIAEDQARRVDAEASLRTCTRIDGLTMQAEEPSQKARRRHLREQADRLLKAAGCPMPLN